MSGPAGFRVVHVCETASVGSFDRVVVWLWHVAPNDEALASVRRAVATVSRRFPEGVGVLHLLPNPDGKIPTDDQRKKPINPKGGLRNRSRSLVNPRRSARKVQTSRRMALAVLSVKETP